MDNNIIKLGKMSVTTDIPTPAYVDDSIAKLDYKYTGSQSAFTYDSTQLVNEGGVISKTGGIYAGAGWLYSDYIELEDVENRQMHITDNINSSNGWGMAFYDENKFFISSFTYNVDDNVEVEIPAKAKYFRYSKSSIIQEIEIDVAYDKDETEGTIGIVVKKTLAKNPVLIKTTTYANDSLENIGAVVKSTDGSLNPSVPDPERYPEYRYSDYIELPASSYKCFLSENMKNAGNWGMAFYDERKHYISGVAYNEHTELEIDVPINAKYLMFSRNSDLKSAAVKINHAEDDTDATIINSMIAKKVPSIIKEIPTLDKSVQYVDADIVNDGAVIDSNTGGYNPANGPFPESYSTWHYSNYIEIPEIADIMVLTENNANARNWGIAFYDSLSSYISGIAYDAYVDYNIKIPTNAKYFRFSKSGNNSHATVKLLCAAAEDKKIISTIVDSKIDAYDETIDQKIDETIDQKIDDRIEDSVPGKVTEILAASSTIIKKIIYDKTQITHQGAVIATLTGSTNPNPPNPTSMSDWFYSDYIEVPNKNALKLHITDNMSAAVGWGMAFYDENKVRLSGFAYNNDNNVEVEIPARAKYFRYSHNNANAIINLTFTFISDEDTNILNECIDNKMSNFDKASALKRYVDEIHDIPNTEIHLDIDGKPLTLWKQNNCLLHGLIPVIVGSKYKIDFDWYDGVNKSRARLGVIDGKTARALADGTYEPSSRDVPVENRYGGPWGINFNNAVLSDNNTKGTMTFTIPQDLDGSDGLYLVLPQYFFTGNSDHPPLESPLNIVLTPIIEDKRLPSTASAIEIPVSMSSLKDIFCGGDPAVKVYGLGDSTNSDDASRYPQQDGYVHFSPTKVIAKRMNAITYQNLSIPGTGVQYMLTASANIPNDATIVVIINGINDINHISSPTGLPLGDIDDILAISDVETIPETTIFGCYVKAVKRLRNRLPANAQIVCVSPYYYKDTNIPADLVTFRAGLKKLCDAIGSRRGMRFIDGCNVGITPENYTSICRDATHPMIEGQTIVASHILEHITPVSIADEQYKLVNVTLKASPANYGRATSSSLNIVPSNLNIVPSNYDVQLSAIPAEGKIFDTWSDDNTDAVRTVQFTADTELTAYFKDPE